MSELLAAMRAGAKPMIGMIALRPLAGGSRYRGGSLADVLEDALQQAHVLRAAEFDMLMVQNLGDLPVATRASPAQVAWMTRIADAVRRECGLPVGLNLLENDAEAMLAIASASDVDFVRIKVFVGAMVTPGGIESGRAFEAVAARSRYNVDAVAIFADVHDRTGVPLATAGLRDDMQAAYTIGGADGLVFTGREPEETLDMLELARTAVPGCRVLVGGGASTQTIAGFCAAADGAIIGSALRSGGHLFGQLEPQRAHDFMAAVKLLRTLRS